MKKGNFKILFISLFNGEALGTRQLFSSIKTRGYDARLLFFKVELPQTYEKRQSDLFTNTLEIVAEQEIDLLVKFIINYNPDVISFSLVSPYFQLYKRLYKRICGTGNYKIVVGGWQASLNPNETIPYCDIVCVGEGEEALPELVDCLYNRQTITNIQNLWFWKDRNSVRPLISDMDSIPDIRFCAESTFYIENNKIVNGDPYCENIRYGIMAGRGCPYHCTYCSNNYMAKNVYPGQWSKVRYRSVDHVIRELLNVKSTFPNIEKINFYDEVFVPRKEWAQEFFLRYKEEIGLPFYCMFYPGTCKEESLKILKNGGLAGVWLGVQSGSKRVRKEVFKRNYSNALILEQANLLKKYGVNVRYDFILDNPFETFEESLESIALMLELPEPYSLNLFSLKYFPNTEITKMALDKGYITEKMLDDQRNGDQHNYFIKIQNKNSPSNFVNILAMYISFLSNKGWVQRNKMNILYLIEDYKINRNIQPVKELLNPFLIDNE